MHSRSRRYRARAALLCILSLLVSGLLTGFAAAPAYARAPVSAGVRLVSADAARVVLELSTSADQLQQGWNEQAACEVMQVAGYGTTIQLGRPHLPVAGILLAVPPGAEAEGHIMEVQTTSLGAHNICPVPSPLLEEGPQGLPLRVGQTWARDMGAYSSDGIWPADLLRVSPPAYVRDRRVVRVALHPVRYRPHTGELYLHHAIRVEVRFVYRDVPSPDDAAERGDREERAVASGPFDLALSRLLLNDASARGWRSAPPSHVSPSGLPSEGALRYVPSGTEHTYRIEVREDGLYRLDYADLEQAGLPVNDLDPRQIKLYYHGLGVALAVSGQEDGAFDPGDTVAFYGLAAHTKYASANVYWLVVGGEEGRRMAQWDGAPSGLAPAPATFTTTVHAEEDHIYWPSPTPSSGQDHWFWTRLVATGSPASTDLPVVLSDVAPGPYTSTVRLALKSQSFYTADPDHHALVYLNGHLIGEDTWDGETAWYMALDVPQALLEPMTNTVTVALPADLGLPYDAVYVDWCEIAYQRGYRAEGDSLLIDGGAPEAGEVEVSGLTTTDVEVYDVTDPLSVTQIIHPAVSPISDTYTVRFAVPPTLAPPRILVLAADRAKCSASVVEDNPSDLQSTDNGADYVLITHADFYTAALSLADHHGARGWRTAVVDVQDIYDEFSYGLLDPEAIRGFLAYAFAHWQAPPPSYVLLVGDGSLDFHDNLRTGEVNYVPPYLDNVDPWLGETASDNRYVAVSGDDILPDMHIGRLPVSSPEQAKLVVDRIISYGPSSPSDGWEKCVLFVADDAEPTTNFAALSDSVANDYLPSDYVADKVYYGVTHPTAEGASDAIIASLHEGRLLVSYAGHAAVPYWAVEHLLGTDDVPLLHNADRLPMMVPMTCYEGLFDYPGYPSLAESLVRGETGGAIASWSPAGLGAPTEEASLSQAFFTALFFDGVHRIGPAVTLAKLALYAGLGPSSLIDTYTLFGDPALTLAGIPDGVVPGSVVAASTTDSVTVSWQTGSEGYLAGFNLYRSREGNVARVRINESPILCRAPDPTMGASYVYTDTGVAGGEAYAYWLEEVEQGGAASWHGPATARVEPWSLYLPLVRGADWHSLPP